MFCFTCSSSTDGKTYVVQVRLWHKYADHKFVKSLVVSTYVSKVGQKDGFILGNFHFFIWTWKEKKGGVLGLWRMFICVWYAGINQSSSRIMTVGFFSHFLHWYSQSSQQNVQRNNLFNAFHNVVELCLKMVYPLWNCIQKLKHCVLISGFNGSRLNF